MCDGRFFLQMEVLDSIIIDEMNETVVTLKNLDALPTKFSHGKFLLSAVIPDSSSYASVGISTETILPRSR